MTITITAWTVMLIWKLAIIPLLILDFFILVYCSSFPYPSDDDPPLIYKVPYLITAIWIFFFVIKGLFF